MKNDMGVECIKWSILKKEIEGWEAMDMADDTRIYFKERGEGNGFDFKQVNIIAHNLGRKWMDEDAECEILLNGVAYFDGIRHLYFGDMRTDNYGYFYYPSLSNIRSALMFLSLLEAKYCPQKD